MNLLFVLPLLIETQTLLTAIFIAVGALLVIAAIVLIVVFSRRKGKKVSFKCDDWLLALGEKDNIKEIKAIGSRLNLVLLDKEKINRERLKELGVTSILVMSNKVTLVIEGQAEKIASSIQKDL